MAETFLVVEGVYKNLASIGDFVEKFAVECGLDDRSVYALQMAVDEACSNIIEHAYGGEGKGKIELELLTFDAGVKVVIKDWGQPFDPSAIAAPNLQAPIEERQEGGLGLFLIRQLMDEVHFSFGNGRGEANLLTLVKGNKPES
jgi:serine/threonine-protein kinase RsbW